MIPNIQHRSYRTRDGYVLDTWEQVQTGSTKTIFYFGGNAEDIAYFISQTQYSGANLIGYNYRGYGASEGTPSQDVLFSDAEDFFEQSISRTDIKDTSYFLMGRSLGSGVATYLASRVQIHGIILITPYDSIESLAQEQFPYIPVSWILKNKFPSIEFAPKMHSPLLVVYAGRDTVVPNSHTNKLLEAWKGSVEKVFIPDADHSTIMTFPEGKSAINQFISSH